MSLLTGDHGQPLETDGRVLAKLFDLTQSQERNALESLRVVVSLGLPQSIGRESVCGAALLAAIVSCLRHKTVV